MKRPKPLVGPTVRCPACDGTGVERGAAVAAFADKHIGNPAPQHCRRCDGRGRVLDSSQKPEEQKCDHNLPRSECAVCRRR